MNCSVTGELCAMKEVNLVSDDARSKESVQQLAQVSIFSTPVIICHIFLVIFFYYCKNAILPLRG